MDRSNRKGKRKGLRGKVKEFWSKLSKSDIDQMADKFDILVRELQDTYGYSRRRAVQVISQRVIDYRGEVARKRARSRYDW